MQSNIVQWSVNYSWQVDGVTPADRAVCNTTFHLSNQLKGFWNRDLFIDRNASCVPRINLQQGAMLPVIGVCSAKLNAFHIYYKEKNFTT